MTALRLIAGKTAAARIEREGLTPDLVRGVLGASGGPKWLILAGLDRFVFGRWLPQSAHQIPLIGSSIGAWRMTLAAHPQPLEAFDRFLAEYLAYGYTKGETATTTTRNSYKLLDRVFSPEDAKAVLGNGALRPLHIVAVLAKGLCGSRSTLGQGVGLFLAFIGNLIARQSLGRHFDRAVFHSGDKVAFSDQWTGFNRLDIPLRPEALTDAVMASGSIPAVIDAIRDIPGAPPGDYRDGGIIDYHFDIPFRSQDGVFLYPHFYDHLVPGWFDKRLGRRAGPDVLDQMVLLTPSDDFLARLPDGQRTDRKDFMTFPDPVRQSRWRTVVRETEALADDFETLLSDHGRLMDRLEQAT